MVAGQREHIKATGLHISRVASARGNKTISALSRSGKKNKEQLPLFSDLGDNVFIPTPVKEFPPVHFMEVAHA
jgi:hypothetical protein